MTTAPCWACRAEIVRGQGNTHHKHIRAAGGSDDPENLVYICATCHDFLHHVAKDVKKGRPAAARDRVSEAYPGRIETQRRIWHLACLAAVSEMDAKEQGPEDDAPHTVHLTVSEYVYQVLKSIAAENGFTRGPGPYLEQLLTQHAFESMVREQTKSAPVLQELDIGGKR